MKFKCPECGDEVVLIEDGGEQPVVWLCVGRNCNFAIHEKLEDKIPYFIVQANGEWWKDIDKKPQLYTKRQLLEALDSIRPEAGDEINIFCTNERGIL